jgi:hypothetical protein
MRLAASQVSNAHWSAVDQQKSADSQNRRSKRKRAGSPTLFRLVFCSLSDWPTCAADAIALSLARQQRLLDCQVLKKAQEKAAPFPARPVWQEGRRTATENAARQEQLWHGKVNNVF